MTKVVQFAAPQVKSIYQLFVMQHPALPDFRVVHESIGIARNRNGAGVRSLAMDTRFSLKYHVVNTLRKLAGHR